MRFFYIICLFICNIYSVICLGQTDTVLGINSRTYGKYLNTLNSKADLYSKRVNNKSLKTLAKLSRWENKIKAVLDKVSPETANKLFNSSAQTFNSVYQKLKEGESFFIKTQSTYNEYLDKVSTGLKYARDGKEISDSLLKETVSNTIGKLDSINVYDLQTQTLQKFIKERKKLLVEQSLKHIGSSKYLKKINKESFYYVESIKNYKEIFSSPKKIESKVQELLSQNKDYQKFFSQNNYLAKLFPSSSVSTLPEIPGLQSRNAITGIINEKLGSGGPNLKEMMSKNIQNVKDNLEKQKNKLESKQSEDSLSPKFKINSQRSKTFIQRLEYGFDFQIGKVNRTSTTATNIGVTAGYKLNDKSIIGFGAFYKIGVGSIDDFNLTNQGFGFKSFMDWKISKLFFITGGFELNQIINNQKDQPNQNNTWQKLGVIGIGKKILFSKSFIKGTKVQLVFDFLHNQHSPISKPILFRVGYTI